MRELPRQTLYVFFVCAGLAAVGLWHILAGPATERVFRNPARVRQAGVALLLLALPCALWPKPYFVTLGLILGISGLVRVVVPGANIELQKQTWPRWGHGCIIIGFAAAVGLCYRGGWPPH